MKKIGVTGTGSLIGQSIIKSIINSSVSDKVDVIGFDYFQNTIGSFWTSKNYILPDILNNSVREEEWLEAIVDIIKKNSIELIFIGVDFELEIFSKHKTKIEIETGAKIIVSNIKSIQIANDKLLTYQFLKNNNLNYPETDLLSIINIEDIKYPKIIKPRIGYRSRDVHLLKSIDDFAKLKISDHSNYIVQDYLNNDQEEYTCGTLSIKDDFKSIILRRTLKEGNTSFAYHEQSDKRIEDYIYNVNSKLNVYGPCNYQLRIDKNGIPKIFEINLRHSGTTYIRSLFGFNEVDFLINKLIFNKELKFHYKYGVAMRYFEEKLIEIK